MTSPHPHNYLGEQTLCAIEQAMAKVWTSLQTSEPSVDWLKNGEVGRAHNQCLSRTSSYQSIESYCPLISQVVLCGMSIEV